MDLSMSMGLRGSPSIREGVGGYSFANTEAEDLVARFAAPQPDADKAAIDAWFTAGKAGGWLADLDGFYCRGLGDSQAGRQNFIQNAYNSTAINSPTFTAYRGFAGDASSSYLNNNFNPTTAPGAKFSQNSAYMAVYCNTSRAFSSSKSTMGNVGSLIKVLSTATLNGVRPNTGGTGNERNLTVASSVGWTSWGRTAAGATEGTDFYVAKDGVAAASSGNVCPSSVLTNENFFELARSNAGTPQQFDDVRSAASAFGQYLTPAKDASLHAATIALLTALGAN